MREELVEETPQLLGIKNSEGVGRDVVVHEMPMILQKADSFRMVLLSREEGRPVNGAGILDPAAWFILTGICNLCSSPRRSWHRGCTVPKRFCLIPSIGNGQ